MQGAPFFRWAGSKRKSLARLQPFWRSSHERYVEPFAGSASLFFAISPKAALINDTNVNLIRAYKAIQVAPEEIFEIYSNIERTEEVYYQIRKQALTTSNDRLLAAHFLYLNRNCFNGLYRTNKRGEFNVPFSSSRVPGILKREQFLFSASKLEGVQFEAIDFEDLLVKFCKKGDMVYLDPPFASNEARVFTEYGPNAFQTRDLKRFCHALRGLDEQGIDFVVSYSYSPEIEVLFQEWSVVKYEVMRQIAGFASSRRSAAEILVTNMVDL